MKDRLELHEELCDVLGSRNCYFQPPSTVQLKYPCIIYSIRRIDTTKADNSKYLYNTSYDLIVIDKNPDSNIPIHLIEHFQMCSFDRSYESDNLNHFSLTLSY
jgi:hypothetical protein